MTEMRPEKKVKDRHPGVLSQYQNPTYSCGARRRSKGRNRTNNKWKMGEGSHAQNTELDVFEFARKTAIRYELLYGSRKCGAGCALAKHSRNGVEKM